MYLASSAKELLSRDLSETAPGFVERLRIVTGEIRERTTAHPFYLTDLGVRLFEDPKLFYSANLKILKIADPLLSSDILAEAAEAPGADLARLLDHVVLLTGDYHLACQIVDTCWENIVESTRADLLIHAGVLLAASADPRCRVVLRRVANLPAVPPTVQFMALHRLAASEIKRFANPAAGIALLDEAEEGVLAAEAVGSVSAADRSSLSSVLANLRALAFIQEGLPDQARAEVERARGLLTLEGLHQVDPSEAARYAAQENINIAQVLALRGNFVAALAKAEENLAFCIAHAPEYLSEALSALAYTQFLTEKYSDAARTAERAALLISREASPIRLAVARRILTGALFRDGDEDTANAVALSIESDPLGLDYR